MNSGLVSFSFTDFIMYRIFFRSCFRWLRRSGLSVVGGMLRPADGHLDSRDQYVQRTQRGGGGGGHGAVQDRRLRRELQPVTAALRGRRAGKRIHFDAETTDITEIQSSINSSGTLQLQSLFWKHREQWQKLNTVQVFDIFKIKIIFKISWIFTTAVSS